MKILELFGGRIRDGGEETFVLNALRNMDVRDAQIDCLVVEDCKNEVFRDWFAQHGGTVAELSIPLHATPFQNHVYKPALEYLQKREYDTVHVHSSSIAALAVLAAAADQSGVKNVIVHAHATGRTDDLRHRAFRFAASLSLRRHADIYCACSRAAAEWKFMPRYAASAVIVRNGIDVDRFRFDRDMRLNMRKKLGIPEDAFVVGHAGRFCEEKNQPFLLNVFALLAQQTPNAYLLLLGDGETLPTVQQTVSQSDFRDRVLLPGSVNNVQEYMQCMDVFVFPSLFEGLGIAAIEAEAAGLPVVASDGVPTEIKLTDDVQFLSLEQNAQTWADTISAFRGRARTDQSDTVRKAGYAIRDTALQMEKLYGIE